MKIHLVHPKFLGDDIITQEHDFLHKLFDSLATDEPMEHPDAFRYNGRRGQLFARHRRLVEEMLLRTSTVTAPWTVLEGNDRTVRLRFSRTREEG